MMVAVERNRQRARAYRVLAKLFRAPEPGTTPAFRAQDLPELAGAVAGLGAEAHLLERVHRLQEALADLPDEALAAAWMDCFEVSGRNACPLGELAYTIGSPQEAWLTGYRLADIAGFYRAFGVEVAPETERADHLAIELEFMHLLAVKEALAQENGPAEGAQVCHDAAVTFLREHLGRWAHQVRDRMPQAIQTFYALAAAVLAEFVTLDRRVLNVED